MKIQRPSQRGLYLIVWGIVYLALALAFIINPNPNLAGSAPLRFLFLSAGILSFLAAWRQKLDPIAFSFLSGAAMLRGLLYFNPGLEVSPDVRISAIVIWIGVGTAQLVVARWPMVRNTNGDKSAVIRLQD